MRRTLIFAAAALALAGCSSSDSPGSVDFGSVETGPVTVTTGSTGSTGSAATGSAATGAGEQVATATASGDLTGSFTFEQVVPFAPGENFLSPTFSDTGTGNTFSFAGAPFTGTKPTSADLVVTIALEQEREGITQQALFTSTDGECSVTIDALGQDDSVTGSIACPEITDLDGATTIGFDAEFQT